jgi:hypothetical protein
VLAYPIFALLLFLIVFLIITIRTWRRSPAEFDRLARMPLDDGAQQGARASQRSSQP